MALYVGYYNFSTDLTLMNAAGVKQKSNAVDDFSVVFAGATIKF